MVQALEESLNSRPIEGVDMPDTKVEQSAAEPQIEEGGKAQQMCCDGKRTAAEHRTESGGKCCSDA